ncbi:YraN family protein [Atopomonas sediminilitoris]|uniref:YraN family protein n=1 Tax=Atopomonas sediminilitoris TaxID=2919919 RepID=UPI001F4E7C7F|nr:YraN family protein [Atopomonas sediminilitoris]MCJ8170683.1 YraN family protein [Atopomonas sediminilitoris]
MTNSTRERGQHIEQAARQYLEQAGLRLLSQNWHCRYGELDLVMLDQDTVAFVEVRYRRSQGFGGALASIDRRKQEKLVTSAQAWLQANAKWSHLACRFDTISASGPEHQLQLEWLRDAFRPTSR